MFSSDFLFLLIDIHALIKYHRIIQKYSVLHFNSLV